MNPPVALGAVLFGGQVRFGSTAHAPANRALPLRTRLFKGAVRRDAVCACVLAVSVGLLVPSCVVAGPAGARRITPQVRLLGSSVPKFLHVLAYLGVFCLFALFFVSTLKRTSKRRTARRVGFLVYLSFSFYPILFDRPPVHLKGSREERGGGARGKGGPAAACKKQLTALSVRICCWRHASLFTVSRLAAFPCCTPS